MSRSNDFLKTIGASGSPCRILVIVHPKSPHFPTPSTEFGDAGAMSIAVGVSELLRVDCEDVKHLSTQLWPSRKIMVFDYRHKLYDFQTADQAERLTTLVVHMAMENKVTLAEGQFNMTINKQVADLHKLNGWVYPPFFEDHRENRVPVYLDPRDLKTSS